MPLYEYHCDNCDATVEVLLRRSDEQPDCPRCHGQQLHRLLSVPASPAVRGNGSSRQPSSLPMASDEGCGAPRCCGGGCQF
jgi:putative FmdB family regulatory protein